MKRYRPRHTVAGEEAADQGYQAAEKRRAVEAVLAAAAALTVVAVIIVLSLPGNGTGRGGSGSSLAGAAPTSSGVPGPSGVRTRGQRSSGGVRAGAKAKAGGGGAAPGAGAADNSSPAVNLAVPAGFGPVLRSTWVAGDPGRAGLVARDVQSTLPGSVFYAEQPAPRTYWAISRFVASPRLERTAATPAGQARLYQFGSVSVFAKVAGGAWRYVGAFGVGTCPSNVPSPVSAAWGLCSVGS